MLTRIKISPVARRDYCHKIKPQVYVYVFTSISVLQNSLSNTTSLTNLDILQLLLKFLDIIIFHDFPWLSITLAVFHDFPGLENGLTKYHDFPWLSRKSGHPDDQTTTTLVEVCPRFIRTGGQCCVNCLRVQADMLIKFHIKRNQLEAHSIRQYLFDNRRLSCNNTTVW